LYSLWDNISYSTIYAVICLVTALLFWRFSKLYCLCLAVVVLNVITELIGLYGVLYSVSFISVYNIYFVVHQSLWLFILLFIMRKTSHFIINYLFLFAAILNLLFFEGSQLNFSTFVFGSFLYLFIFLYQNIILLRKEDIHFFTSSKFLLLSSPVFFFFAMSFIFCFRESGMDKLKIFGYLLYDILSTTGNTIYYSLLILYIIKSRNDKTPAHD
jgi:hypothetical protein